MIQEWRIEGYPVPKGSLKPIRTKTGRIILVPDNQAELKVWTNTIHQQLVSPYMIDEGPVAVDLIFFMPRPKTVKREAPWVYPDLDKLLRAVLDALTGKVYRDDGQVIWVHMGEEYADNEEPGVFIRVKGEAK